MGNTTSSFYNGTPNYATGYPTQNDTNTEPVTGNTAAPTSFYRDGTDYVALENADNLVAEMEADLAAAAAQAAASAASASAAAASAASVPALLATYAPLASPALTGTPTAPTPVSTDNSTKLSTTAYVQANIAPLIGSIVYQGTWNASTNTPHLTSGSGTKGWLYKVSTPGTTTIDGISSWNAGDCIVFDGTTWDKVDGQSSEVISVAGRTGTVTLAVGDVSGAAPLASPALTGVPTAPTATVGTNTTQIATTAFVLANAAPGSVFGASGPSHSQGVVPDPGSTSGTTRYLREDATWAAPSGSTSTFNQYEYTGLTTCTGSDNNGATLAYTVGFIEVFVNGLKLNKGDYTATTGTSVVIGSTVGSTDLVTILAFSAVSVSNTLAPSNNLSDVANAATARANLGAAPAITTISNSLSADVSMTSGNINTYSSGPAVAQGTAGTWLVSGTITVSDSATASRFSAKLWDGTTLIASAQSVTAAANNQMSISLSGVISSPAGNLRIDCSSNSTTSKIVFNASGLSKDSTITAVRIA